MMFKSSANLKSELFCSHNIKQEAKWNRLSTEENENAICIQEITSDKMSDIHRPNIYISW